jgi:hypothetical protein
MSIDEVLLQSKNIHNNNPVQPNIRPDAFYSTTTAYNNPIHLGTLPYFFHRVDNPIIQQISATVPTLNPYSRNSAAPVDHSIPAASNQSEQST